MAVVELIEGIDMIETIEVIGLIENGLFMKKGSLERLPL